MLTWALTTTEIQQTTSERTNNKNTFQEDAYRPLQWLPLDAQLGLYLGGSSVWREGVFVVPVDRQTPVKTLPSRNLVCGR